MRLPLDKAEGQKLFFTAGNLPTQAAYELNQEEVTDAFTASILLGDHLLLAASYFYESPFTRSLVKSFPTLWHSGDARAVFFMNAEYHSFTDHGFGKAEKSPSSFSPYANLGTVRKHGAALDDLGFVGTRANLDISRLLVEMWVRSCSSSEPGSLGALLSQGLSADQAERTIASAIHLAESCQYDFIWPALEKQVEADATLRRVRRSLQRAHADMYAQFMSITLDAVETTPTCSSFGNLVSERSVGHLGLFAGVLRRVGIELPNLREEESLLAVLQYEPLELIRQLHSDIVKAAVQAQQNASDYWRAIELFEGSAPRPALTDVHLRTVMTNAFNAAGVHPEAQTLERILALERAYQGGFLTSIRTGLEAALQFPEAASPSSKKVTAPKDVLLFTWADPLGPNCGIGADREFQAVQSGLEGLREKCNIHVELEPAITSDRLPSVVARHQPKIFHFSGHGSKQGSIAVEPGRSDGLLRISDVLSVLASFSKVIECAVFSACHSVTAEDEIGASVRYVILMSSTLDEVDAASFARGFYLKLGIGLDVPSAFDGGLALLRLENRDDSLPQMYEWGRLVAAPNAT